MFWIIPPLVIAGGIVLASRPARGSTDPDRGDNHVDFDDAQPSDVATLAAAIGAPSVWQDFFTFTAYGESKMRPDVGLGILDGAPPWADINKSKSEARAARITYEKNLKWLEPCAPKALYSFGSGGLFAMLPAAALAAFKGDPIYNCTHPWSIFDPRASMIYGAHFADRLQGWSNWLGTVESTRVGWGNPSKMGKSASDKQRSRWAGHLAAVGLPTSFLQTKLPRWKPADAVDLWQATGVDNGWLPQAALEAA